jgi:hypothetical protein
MSAQDRKETFAGRPRSVHYGRSSAAKRTVRLRWKADIPLKVIRCRAGRAQGATWPVDSVLNVNTLAWLRHRSKLKAL